MSEYDYKADAKGNYQVWILYMREKTLREGTWKRIGPRNEAERETAEGK